MSAQDPQTSRRRRVIVVDEPAGDANAPTPYLTPETASAASGPSPQDAPEPPDLRARHEGRAADAPTRKPATPSVRRDRLFRVFALLAGMVFAIGFGFWIDGVFDRAWAASPLLGGAVLGLTAALLAAAAALALRELASIGRMNRLSAIRNRAEAARKPGATAADVDAVLCQLQALYRDRRDLAWATEPIWSELRSSGAQSGDRSAARDRLDRCETDIIGRLDAMASAEIERAARRVAAATALMPSALLDAAAALVVNLGMIRRIAEIYGGRASALGSVRLARRVVAHAMAAGLIEIGGDLLTPMLGGGLAGSASRRLGEGVVNGAMTVRIGLAAADFCRPIPYGPGVQPKAAALAWRALSSFGGRSGDGPPSGSAGRSQR